jgi:hypothetical protein
MPISREVCLPGSQAESEERRYASPVVRATDGAGQLQPAAETATLPDGATGWHRVTVGVA